MVGRFFKEVQGVTQGIHGVEQRVQDMNTNHFGRLLFVIVEMLMPGIVIHDDQITLSPLVIFTLIRLRAHKGVAPTFDYI